MFFNILVLVGFLSSTFICTNCVVYCGTGTRIYILEKHHSNTDLSIISEFKQIIDRNVNNISDYFDIFLSLSRICYLPITSPLSKWKTPQEGIIKPWWKILFGTWYMKVIYISHNSQKSESIINFDSNILFRPLVGGCPCSVKVKALKGRIVVSEFKLQLCYYVHFQINTLGKGMNLLILPAIG